MAVMNSIAFTVLKDYLKQRNEEKGHTLYASTIERLKGEYWQGDNEKENMHNED
jgi:hypothetical protein